MRVTTIMVLCLAACARSLVTPTSFHVDISGRGRPVVFIPDLGASSGVWDTTIAHLGGRVEAHALTLAGFAGQARVEGPILPRVERELARYLRDRHLRGAVVVGHMFGAAVAYSLAVAEPDLVGGIVVIDTLPCQSALAEPDEPRAQALVEAQKTHDMLASRPPNVDQMERRLRTMMTDPARARKIAEESSLSSGQSIADAYLELMQMDLRNQVRSLRSPALVVVTDLTYPPDSWSHVVASWHRQVDSIPRHELVEVRGAHHYVMFDKPEAWFAALDRFLGALPEDLHSKAPDSPSRRERER
jgi:pimeloyl-ACP methyl ester carboxylesterase